MTIDDEVLAFATGAAELDSSYAGSENANDKQESPFEKTSSAQVLSDDEDTDENRQSVDISPENVSSKLICLQELESQKPSPRNLVRY